MARLAKIKANERRMALVAKYRPMREALKETLRTTPRGTEAYDTAEQRLRALPRDASPTRVRNRCKVTGRARAVYRKFGLSRIALRMLARQGDVPGVTKASW